MIRVNTKVDFDISSLIKKHRNAAEKAQFLLDQQVVKDSNQFIPQDEATLKDSALTYSQFGAGEIGWNTPYARRLYYNPQFNFSKDRNSQARGMWYEAAKARYGKEWIKLTENEYLRGFK